jgi:hypothetical protein
MGRMGRPTSKIGFQNSRDDKQPITIYVEPLGEDFTLLAGDQLELIATGNTEPPWFNIVEWGNDTQVYLEGDGEAHEFEVLQNGKRLECGHNRPLTQLD